MLKVVKSSRKCKKSELRTLASGVDHVPGEKSDVVVGFVFMLFRFCLGVCARRGVRRCFRLLRKGILMYNH